MQLSQLRAALKTLSLLATHALGALLHLASFFVCYRIQDLTTSGRKQFKTLAASLAFEEELSFYLATLIKHPRGKPRGILLTNSLSCSQSSGVPWFLIYLFTTSQPPLSPTVAA